MYRLLIISLIVSVCFISYSQADYKEGFEGFYVQSPFEIPAYGSNWDANLNFDIVATSGSGNYYGGYALKRTGASDVSISTTAEFNLAKDGDGIEYGFDLQINSLDPGNYRMYLRVGSDLSVSVGTGGDRIIIRDRPGEWGGTVIEGTNPLSTYYQIGDWLRFKLVLTGTNWDTATVLCENLTTGVTIPSGLTSVSVADNKTPSWSSLYIRTATVAGQVIDNVYVKDYYASAEEYFATEPLPIPGATDIDYTGVELSWAADPMASSSRVYFGSDPYNMEMIADTTAQMLTVTDANEPGERYHWQVNQVVSGVEYPGYVWSFTTEDVQGAGSALMAYEGFDYDALDYLSNNAPGGTGWIGGWQGSASTSTNVYAAAGSIEPDVQMNYQLTPQANSAQAGASYYAMRKMEDAVDMGITADYYISYLVNLDDNTYNSSSVGLYQNGDSTSPWLFRSEMFYIGYPGYDLDSQFALRSNSNVSTKHVSWESGTTYMVVVKIDADADGDDIVSVKVFDAANPVPTAEPTSWDASFTADLDSQYSWFSIYGRAANYTYWTKDEIYVGMSWASVTGNPVVCGDPFTSPVYDLSGDCIVDIDDLKLFAAGWLDCTNPDNMECASMLSDDPTTDYTDPKAEFISNPSAITVDGDLSDWKGQSWIDYRFAGGYPAGSPALDVTAAKAAFSWNDSEPDTVYVAVVVTDNDLNFGTDPNMWNDGENIEVRFSANSTSTATDWYDNETYDTAQYYQIFRKDDGSSVAYFGPGGRDLTVEAAGADMDYATAIDSVGNIVYEMAIPAYQLYDISGTATTMATIADGEEIAFNLQINSVSTSPVGIDVVTLGIGSLDTFKIAETEDSGSYVGGYALEGTAYNTWDNASTHGTFTVNPSSDITMSVDTYITTSSASMQFVLREGITYGPYIVISNDSTLELGVREAGNGAYIYSGTSLAGRVGHWIRIALTFNPSTGAATTVATDLTTGETLDTGATASCNIGTFSFTQPFYVLRQLCNDGSNFFDNITVNGEVKDFEDVALDPPLAGALFSDQAHTPVSWDIYTAKDAAIGDWGFADTDFDTDGRADYLDYLMIAENWGLSTF
jgi:hypothetical protein